VDRVGPEKSDPRPALILSSSDDARIRVAAEHRVIVDEQQEEPVVHEESHSAHNMSSGNSK
jgi:hypothetical protein